MRIATIHAAESMIMKNTLLLVSTYWNHLATNGIRKRLNIAVNIGDTIEIKWITPTWTTNPGALTFNSLIFIE